MPRFDNASEVEEVCWQLKQADWPRGLNRARINDLFNGVPPYTEHEAQENNLAVNVNFLESTKLAHDARSQFYNAFMKPGNFFTARTDMGPIHKRSRRSAVVTRAVNKIMKHSLPYFEKNRSVFASDVLHGIGPATWIDGDRWCPKPLGVEDVLMAGNTLITFENLPFFALYKSLSYPELWKQTKAQEQVDPGWNMTLVDKCLEWIDRESVRLMGSNWPEIWAPEKLAERTKSDGGFYVGDNIPTIECFDFYFYDTTGDREGWRRRIILDSWAISETATSQPKRKEGDIYRNDAAFLYSSYAKPVASKREEIISFQIADLSAVSPFRYHSIRSLGFLLYAVCHLQNRLRCRFNEAVFEALMMYFRVKTMDDAQRALKLELVNRGFIEDGITPVTAQDRYQVNAPLVQLGLDQNQRIITENSSSYVQQPNYSQGGVEKTKFQVMAETNAMTSLVSAALTQAYMYQNFENREILRRFFRPLSKDPEVRQFRAEVTSKDVPENMLNIDAWETEPERVMGAGNKTLEMTIAQQLMEWRDKFDPEPQRAILRDSVLAITDDPARAESLVPESPVKITDSVHDAQLAAGVLMQGLPVALKTGMNHIEYVETLLVSLASVIQRAQQNGNMASPAEITGMQNIGRHIAQHIGVIAQDEMEKARVKQYGDQLGKLMNEVKGFAQRLQKAMQAQAQQGNGAGGMEPKDQAKIQATMATAKAKVQNMRESHANRTAQRQIQFEQEEQRRQQEHRLEMDRRQQESALELQKKRAEVATDIRAKDLQTAAEIRRQNAKPKPKPKSSE